MARLLSPIEERFCRENGIDKDLARGVRFDSSPKRSRIDPLWLQGAFDERPILEQIESVAIAKQSRFSNAIAKIYNAYCFAARWRIPKVYCGDLEILMEGAGMGSVSFFRGEPREKNYLTSLFFYNKTLADLCRGAPSRLQVLRSLVPYYRFTVPAPLAAEEGNRDLYIHIRSGDLFRKEAPHFQYGQPPLSFYKKVLAYQKWERVFLVYEDQTNPVIAALEESLRLLGMPWKAQSGDLRSDIEFLCRAKNLVVGRGTFIYPVLCVSPNIQRVFFFEEEPTYCFDDNQRIMWGLDKSSIEFTTVRDVTGIYRADILTRWTNSEEQRELMLTYDEKNLEVQEAQG